MNEIRTEAPASQPTQELFVDEWRVYRKMVDNDYLFHRGAYERLHQCLIEEVCQPFRFLDVACGDASMTVGALKGTPIAQYYGIDISQQALDIASRTLDVLDCPVRLERRDFVTALPVWRDPVDIVWIGLSLHHLLAPGKLAIMRDIRRLIGDRGLLLVYENASPDGESRDSWLTRWDRQKESWTAYTQTEWESVTAHVHASDFPETNSRWHDLGRQAGFGKVRELFASPSDLFRLYAFSNPG